MDFSGNQFSDIMTLVAAFVAAALVLSGTLGQPVMLIAESIKSAFHVQNGSGGLIATAVGMFLIATFGAFAAVLSVENWTWTDLLTYAAIGALMGVFVGSGAIQSHKSASTVGNTETKAASYNLGVADAMKESELLRTARVTAAANARPMSFVGHTFSGGIDESAGEADGTSDDHDWLVNGDADQTFEDWKTADIQKSLAAFDETSAHDFAKSGGCECTPSQPLKDEIDAKVEEIGAKIDAANSEIESA